MTKCKLFLKPPRSRPDPSQFPLCECGCRRFSMLDGDESTGFYLAACESCGKEYIFGIVNGEVKVVPNIECLPD